MVLKIIIFTGQNYSLACNILVNDFSVNLGVYSLVAIGTLFSIQKWGAFFNTEWNNRHMDIAKWREMMYPKFRNTPILEIQFETLKTMCSISRE